MNIPARALVILFSLLSAFILSVCPAEAQKKAPLAYRGFSGGMMLHSGYLQSGEFQVSTHAGQTESIRMSGMPFGIGGAMRFMFGNHLRIGAEGYVSNLTYGKHKSNAETGWGGFLADWCWELRTCRIFIGGTAGGGSQTNTIVLSKTGNDYNTDDIAYRKYRFMALAPFAGIEIRLTAKTDIVLKADWLMAPGVRESDFVSGPRIYIGFMFGHRK